jgi:Holliday junction resolvasome RuvABC endonuclease subunit
MSSLHFSDANADANRKINLQLFQLQEKERKRKERKKQRKIKKQVEKKKKETIRFQNNIDNHIDDPQIIIGLDLSPKSPGMTVLDNCNSTGQWRCNSFFIPQSVNKDHIGIVRRTIPKCKFESCSFFLETSLELSIRPLTNQVQSDIKEEYKQKEEICYYQKIASILVDQIEIILKNPEFWDYKEEKKQKQDFILVKKRKTATPENPKKEKEIQNQEQQENRQDEGPALKRQKTSLDSFAATSSSSSSFSSSSSSSSFSSSFSSFSSSSSSSFSFSKHKPKVWIALEDYAMFVDPKQCQKLYQVHELGGVVKAMIVDRGWHYETLNILQNKNLFSGNGHASKQLMIYHFHQKINKDILNLYTIFNRAVTQKKTNPIDDIVDSFALASFCLLQHHECS